MITPRPATSSGLVCFECGTIYEREEDARECEDADLYELRGSEQASSSYGLGY